MKTTKRILALITAFAILILAACSNRAKQDGNTTPSNSTPEPSSALSSESQNEAPQEESPAEEMPTEETVQADFSTPLMTEFGDSVGNIDFTIRIPKNWSVKNMEMLEGGNTVAEVPPARKNSAGQSDNVFADMDFALGNDVCVSSGDFAVGQHPVKYYHRKYEVPDECAYNDVMFCLDILNEGHDMLLIRFNIADGTDEESQIERFSALVNTIELA